MRISDWSSDVCSSDLFFHTELADHFAARGFACYALDLPKCGRSRRDGQTPHFTSNLAHYDGALEAALEAIGAADVLMYGHSAGGLKIGKAACRESGWPYW